jgi:UMF1 family MFS transporter
MDDTSPAGSSELAQIPSIGGPAEPRVISKRSVTGWVLYDLANTIFSMGVISLTLPFWMRQQVGSDKVDFQYGIVSAISMAVVFVLSPLLGAMTDHARRRLPFLMASTIICVALTTLMARFGLWWTCAIFILANIAYQAGTQYYDSLLPEVSNESNRGKIGGIGVGIGYLGSFIAVGLSLQFKDAAPSTLFTLYAVAFLLFALPCMIFVRERDNPRHRRFGYAEACASLKNTWKTLVSSQEYPGLARFLIGRMFYTDSINTVISVMTLFVVNVAVTAGGTEQEATGHKDKIMLLAISLAMAGGFAWGWLNDRLGPRRTLNAVLSCWMAIFLLGAAIGILGLPLWTMYLMAGAAGFCLGGVWAADRPFMLRLTPPDRIGEFYGLYGMVGRFSAITGPLVWALITSTVVRSLSHGNPASSPLEQAQWARIAQGWAAFALLFMMIVGFCIVRKVSDAPRDWSKSGTPKDETVKAVV